LQALALRTGKTYLHEPPALVRKQPEIFLDFEGVPDRDTQYLLGLLVRQHDDVSYHAFWADTDADEARIWHELLRTLDAYPNAPLYHYGQYEARAIRVLLKRYGCGYFRTTVKLLVMAGFGAMGGGLEVR
jgi:predicted RecB family nuclease